MPTVTRRARRFVTSDGMGLLIVGIVALARGVSYAPGVMPDEARASHIAETWLPMGIWALVWSIVGILCLIAVFRWWTRLAAMAVGLAVGLHFLFASSFLWGSIHGDMSRGWVSALSYYAISFIILWAMGRGRREDGEVIPLDNDGEVMPRDDPA